MTRRFHALILLAWGVGASNLVGAAQRVALSVEPGRSREETVAVIQSYKGALRGIRAANPDVRLEVGRDPSLPDEPVLLVEYPAPTGDPAGRDVQCDAETQDWTAARAISFQVRPAHAMRLSFFDRNRVVYTTWVDLMGDAWQSVRVPFIEMRPNPYFQPPDAKKGTSIDVSEVKFIAFAPQDRVAGRLAISRFVVVK
jgi:hypothetical protein